MECFLDNGDGEGLRVEVVLQLVLQLSQVLLLNALQKNADTDIRTKSLKFAQLSWLTPLSKSTVGFCYP
jgi:hypothetical protein